MRTNHLSVWEHEVKLKYIIEKGEKLKLTEKYKDYIVNNGEDLKILLGEWCDEHLVPDNFVKEIRKVV